jgi:hypothetical protein
MPDIREGAALNERLFPPWETITSLECRSEIAPDRPRERFSVEDGAKRLAPRPATFAFFPPSPMPRRPVPIRCFCGAAMVRKTSDCRNRAIVSGKLATRKRFTDAERQPDE